VNTSRIQTYTHKGTIEMGDKSAQSSRFFSPTTKEITFRGMYFLDQGEVITGSDCLIFLIEGADVTKFIKEFAPKLYEAKMKECRAVAEEHFNV
jgi:hypothetical protein